MSLFREANLYNRKFHLSPVAGDLVLITEPISVLERKGAEDKIARRIREMDKTQMDFVGVLGMLDKGDVKDFLSVDSRKMEKGMTRVIAQTHGAGPRHDISARPTLAAAARAKGPAPK